MDKHLTSETDDSGDRTDDSLFSLGKSVFFISAIIFRIPPTEMRDSLILFASYGTLR
jgi:hypothetical protein